MNKDDRILAMKQNIISLHSRIAALEECAEWIPVEKALPPAKEGWRHSEEVELFYPGTEFYSKRHSIGHYHHEPPYESPHFVDWSERFGRQPTHWRKLQEPIEP